MSSYDAFSKVDDLVAKPVMGSDGAAKWQDFKKASGAASHSSVAPTLPVKRKDRIAGLVENDNAVEVSEYTTFKRKVSLEEKEEAKRRKLIMNRVRPDKVRYYIEAATFEGHKFDYVFTTRDRGTGYYWDGMDSVKKLQNNDDNEETTKDEPPIKEKDNEETEAEPPKKKKKKKKDKKEDEVVGETTFHPLQQVHDAIQRGLAQRQQQNPLLQQSTQQKWESAKDPSGKTYYFCRATGERSWNAPAGVSLEEPLPDGWKAAKDPRTGKEYYYHGSSGETKWERPTE